MGMDLKKIIIEETKELYYNEFKERLKRVKAKNSLMLDDYDSLEVVPIRILDLAAFGISDGEYKVPLNMINIVYNDLEIAEGEIDLKVKSGQFNNNIEWAKTVLFKEPIEIKYKSGGFQLEDGHHRYYAAKLLNKPWLLSEITIDDSPIKELERNE